MCARKTAKCLVIVLLIINLINLVSGCSSKEEDGNLFSKYYRLPEKIIIYNQGNKNEFDKEDQLYRGIIQLLNQMFADVQDIGITKTAIVNMKKIRQKDVLALEFIYTDNYEFHYKDMFHKLRYDFVEDYFPRSFY